MNKFFKVITVSLSDEKFAYCEPSDDSRYIPECPRCPKCGARIGLDYWAEPRKAILSRPKYGDFVSGNEFLVSEQFKEAYKKSGLKGVERFVPVEIIKVRHIRNNPPVPPKYFSLELGYSFARIDINKSVILGQYDERYCDLCNPFSCTKDKIDGIYIDDTNWEGEDIFHLHEMGVSVFVTQRFVDFCIDHEFTNFMYVSTQDYKSGYFD